MSLEVGKEERKIWGDGEGGYEKMGRRERKEKRHKRRKGERGKKQGREMNKSILPPPPLTHTV